MHACKSLLCLTSCFDLVGAISEWQGAHFQETAKKEFKAPQWSQTGTCLHADKDSDDDQTSSVVRQSLGGAQDILPSFRVCMQELTGLRITDVHGLQAAASGNAP